MVSIIVSISVSLLLYFLNKASKKEALSLINGSYELRMNRAYQIIGIAGIFSGLIFLFVPVMISEYSLGIILATGLMFLFFIGISVPCLLWYKNHYVRFDNISVYSNDLYGRNQQINWKDITSASFKPFAGVMALSDRNGNAVKVHQHLVGFSTFMETLLIQRDRYNFNCTKLPPNTEG